MPASPRFADLSALAVVAARLAGSMLAEMAPRRHDLRRAGFGKVLHQRPVTAADLEAERIVVEVLLEARPNDAVLAEEGSSRGGTSGVTWVIDPLDGTTNFLYGYGDFAVSIAAQIDDTVVAGVVHDPIADETFIATLQGGATLNERTISPSVPGSLETSLVGTGFGYRAGERSSQARLLPYLLPAIRDNRRGGSAALDCCEVGAGRLDIYYESELKPWDCAAGLLIAEEAGCKLPAARRLP